jgi:hypothetical protein
MTLLFAEERCGEDKPACRDSQSVCRSSSSANIADYLDGSTVSIDFAYGGTNYLGIAIGARSADTRNLQTIDNVVLTLVPEPSTYALLFGLAVIGWVFIRRRK